MSKNIRILQSEHILDQSPAQHRVARAILAAVDPGAPDDTPEYGLYRAHADVSQMFFDDALPLLAAWGQKSGFARPMTPNERTELISEMLLLRRAVEIVALDRVIGMRGPAHDEAVALEENATAGDTRESEDEAPVIPIRRVAYDAEGKTVTDEEESPNGNGGAS